MALENLYSVTNAEDLGLAPTEDVAVKSLKEAAQFLVQAVLEKPGQQIRELDEAIQRFPFVKEFLRINLAALSINYPGLNQDS